MTEEFEDFMMTAADKTAVMQFAEKTRSQRLEVLFGIFAEYVVDQHRPEIMAYRWVASSPS